jgi:S-methylmethionine-dependent homocysteine/selenocysteine methylase
MTNRGGRISGLHDRLALGEVVVMDGGSGTELQAMGVPMDRAAWSGVANLTHPETVRELHANYLAAGAEILITNTFAAGPGALEAAGCGGRFEEANRNAVAAAAAARAEAARDAVVIAGSMSRMAAGGLSAAGETDAAFAAEGVLLDAYRRQAEVLTGAGVDALVLEMMGAREHALPAVVAAAETGLPVWLGISVAEAGSGRAETIDGEDVAGLLRSLPLDAIDAVFVMHTDIGPVPGSLDAIRAVWDGVLGAYPHVGDWTPPVWVFHDIAPLAFADEASEWVSHGATIVGGCCGIGPSHIAAVSDRCRTPPGTPSRWPASP